MEDKLHKWIDSLNQIHSIDLDVDCTEAELAEKLKKRQQSIDEIRKLDAFIQKTMKSRQQGWPDLDKPSKQTCEALVKDALSICSIIVHRDRQLIEKAREKRQDLLSKLQNSKKGKGYFSQKSPSNLSAPVIVDDNA